MSVGSVTRQRRSWAIMCLLAAGPFWASEGEAEVTSTGSYSQSIPLKLPSGRAGLQPSLALVYDSGSGSGPLGVGWRLSGLPVITRRGAHGGPPTHGIAATYSDCGTSCSNLALHKPATRSSDYSGSWPASLAVDGDTSGVCNAGRCSITRHEPGAWWQVDLGSLQSVKEVTVYGASEACCVDQATNVNVFDSADGLSWRSQNIPGSTAAGVTVRVGRVARYVKVQHVGTSFLSLGEVVVKGGPAGPGVSADQFHYAGQKLLKVDPGCTEECEYRTEVESWQRIESHGTCGAGPCSWTVTAPDGLVRDFGATADSRIEAVGRGGSVREWALSTVRDANGNRCEADYAEDGAGGDYHPLAIRYTLSGGSAGSHSVSFLWEPRPDVGSGYASGSRVVTSKRLAAVEVKSGALRQRQYLLRYDTGGDRNHSRLASVQECGSDGVTCLPARTFEYESGPSGWAGTTGFAAPGVFSWSSNCAHEESGSGLTPTDLNGDGLVDMVDSRSGDVHLNTGSGWTAAPLWRLPIPLSGHAYHYHSSGAQLMDVNSDGLTDLVQSWSDTGTPSCGVAQVRKATWLNTGSGWAPTEDFLAPVLMAESSNCAGEESRSYGVMGADVNGDGLTDLVVGASAEVHLNNGRGWTHTPAWTLPVTLSGHNHYWRGSGARLMDVNGDGLTDLVQSWSDTGTPSCALPKIRQATWLNTGAGWEPTTDFIAPVLFAELSNCSGVPSWDYGVTGVDLNADGATDFVDGGGEAHLNHGRGWTQAPAWTLPVTLSGHNYYWRGSGAQLMDVNGDGLIDLVQAWDNRGTPSCGVSRVYKAQWLSALTRKPDVLTSVSNGLGGTERIEYTSKASVAGAVLATPASESFLLTPTEGNLPSPGGWVVTRVTASPDAGATTPYETRYSYLDGRRWWSSDWEERKALGFRRRVTQQYNGGTPGKQAIAYARHSTGRPDEVKSAGFTEADEVRDASGALWSRTSYAYEIGGATPVPGQKAAARPVVVEMQTFDGLVP